MFIPFHDDNPTRRTAVVTYAIVAANVLAFVWFARLPQQARGLVTLHRGFVPQRIAQLYDPRPILIAKPVAVAHPLFGRAIVVGQVRLEPDRGEILVSLLTCMFLHAGVAHLLFNMWFLWLFGNNVEDRLGPVAYLLFYLVGGLVASACHWAVAPASVTPVIGASGAVAAVLGAYAITWPWARIHTLVWIVFLFVVDVPALVVLGIWFVGQVLSAQRDAAGGVAWWAHVGGFLAGMAMMPVLGWLLGVDDDEPPSAEIVEVVDD
ncbi:MAG: rhomboid family intramembrane serine protease [Pirellulales bacterium]|nr:rhomboid family intramembrane serine protease [Pirellulales bacterium]